jgi:hypothetical protein
MQLFDEPATFADTLSWHMDKRIFAITVMIKRNQTSNISRV